VDAESIVDLFAAFGPVRVRRMFGGQGIYAGERMFAIESGGDLWLKVDAQTQSLFEKAGSRPFVYSKKTGEQVLITYWRLPDEASDDPELAAEWARLALGAARRAQTAKAFRASDKNSANKGGADKAARTRPGTARRPVKRSAKKPR
jgi:DNA transformation protein